MAVEGLIFIDKFPELGIDARERLVRIEGRHIRTSARILRFREETQDYEHVIEGGGAEHWPILIDLKTHFSGQPFTSKQVYQELTISRSTGTRVLNRLLSVGAIRKLSFGTYSLSEAI
jgi:hypothetical protein